MFTPTLTHEFDDINKNFVTLYEDLDGISFILNEGEEYSYALDQDAGFVSFNLLVDNDLSFIFEELPPPDNVNFV